MSSTYLGIVISSDGKMKQEITESLGKGAGFYDSIKHIIKDKYILKKAKVTKYTTYFVPILFMVLKVTEGNLIDLKK